MCGAFDVWGNNVGVGATGHFSRGGVHWRRNQATPTQPHPGLPIATDHRLDSLPEGASEEADMTDLDLTVDEMETLARFQSLDQPEEVDPRHFAKLLSLALVEQKEDGPELTSSGLELLRSRAADAELDKQLEQTFPASDPPKITRNV